MLKADGSKQISVGVTWPVHYLNHCGTLPKSLLCSAKVVAVFPSEMSPNGGILTIKGSGFSSMKSEMKIMVIHSFYWWNAGWECFILEDSWVSSTEVKCMLPTWPGYYGLYDHYQQQDISVQISVTTPGNLYPVTSTCEGCVSGKQCLSWNDLETREWRCSVSMLHFSFDQKEPVTWCFSSGFSCAGAYRLGPSECIFLYNMKYCILYQSVANSIQFDFGKKKTCVEGVYKAIEHNLI